MPTTRQSALPPLDAFAFGGGWQSMAALVLARRGLIECPRFLFANTGDDSEDERTLRYVREVAFDYAWSHGIELLELGPARGVSLYRRMMDVVPGEGLRQPIPVRAANGKPLKRSCTAEWKRKVVGDHLRSIGYSAERKAHVGIGISLDEWDRANENSAEPYEVLHYPLLRLEWKGGVGLTRADCGQLIKDEGLPIPPKSSCYFCPFHRPSTWAEMRRDRPADFERSAQLEDHLNVCAAAVGKRPVYLTRFGKPLREAIAAAQDGLFGLDWDDDDGYRCGDVCDT